MVPEGTAVTTALVLLYAVGFAAVFLNSSAAKPEDPLQRVGVRLGMSISWPLFAAAVSLLVTGVLCTLAVLVPFVLASLVGQRRRDKARWAAEFAAAVRSREGKETDADR